MQAGVCPPTLDQINRCYQHHADSNILYYKQEGLLTNHPKNQHLLDNVEQSKMMKWKINLDL